MVNGYYYDFYFQFPKNIVIAANRCNDVISTD